MNQLTQLVSDIANSNATAKTAKRELMKIADSIKALECVHCDRELEKALAVTKRGQVQDVYSFLSTCVEDAVNAQTVTVGDAVVRAYLRASTDKQDAKRAKDTVKSLAKVHGKRVGSWYIENMSGNKAVRPELERLLEDAGQGDILLIEHIDRLTRLSPKQWDWLKARIKAKGIKLCIANNPLTHGALGTEEQTRIVQLVTDLIVDITADAAHSDYVVRRERQAQGIAKAKADGVYQNRKGGRSRDEEMYVQMDKLIAQGLSNTAIAKELGCSTKTVQRHKSK